MFYAAQAVELMDRREKVDRSMGDVHAEGNPHFHLHPPRLLQVAGHMSALRSDAEHSSEWDSAIVAAGVEKPFFAEVQLKAGGMIRGDVVLEPGKVDFGSLADVSAVRQTFVVDYRGGMANWQVVDVTSTFPHVRVSLQETQRQRGRVVYSLGVRLLPEAGSGFHQTELVLLTNDPANREIPVSVTAKILEPLQVTPSYFDLGDVPVGQQVTKHLLVRSTEACQIVAASGDKASVQPIVTAGAKTLHRIPVQFTAGPELGQLQATVTIKTDSGVQQTVPLQANIVPPRQ
jgi:hypothetical protein